MLISVTGRIGSGKSTVSSEIAKRLNATIVDADKIAREITMLGGSAVSAIETKFGSGFIKSGAMDREKMRNLVFSNPAAKNMLEMTLRPYIQSKIAEDVESAKKQKEFIVLDIPLLVDSVWKEKSDFIVTVDVQEEVQIERIKKRNGHSDETILKMINSQPSRKKYKDIASFVFDNTTYDLFDFNIIKVVNAIQEKKKKEF